MNGENTRVNDGRAARAAAWLGFSLLLAFLVFTVFFPGAMTNDSVAWLSAGRSGAYTGGQSVAVQVLCGFLDRFLPGPLLFIALNVSLLVLGTTAIVFLTGWTLLRDIVASLLVLLYPLCLLPAAVAWRDVTCLGLYAVCAAVVILLGRQEDRRGKLLLLLACGLLALAAVLLKENAPAAFLPLLTWAFLGLAPRGGGRSFRRLIVCAAAALLLLVAGLWLSLRVTSSLARERSLAKQPLLNCELALLSDRVGENLFPEEVFPGVTLERVRYFLGYYGAQAYWRGFWPAYSKPAHDIFPRTEDERLHDLLAARWGAAVFRHQLAYAGVRLKLASFWWRDAGSLRRGFGVLDMDSARRAALKGELALDFPTRRFPWSDRLLEETASFAERRLPFHPMIYLGAAALFLLAAFALRLPSRVPALVLWLSGLTHFLATAAVVPHWEFRFGYQAVFLAVLAVVLCLRDATYPGAWRRS